MINIIEVVKSIATGLILGFIFLLLALFLLPELAIVRIIKTLKPHIYNWKDPIYKKILLIIVNGIKIDEEREYEQNSQMNELVKIKKELELFERDLFIIDSLIGILETISYLIDTDVNNYALFEDICDYFIHYAKSFHSKSKSDNIRVILSKFYEFQDKATNIRANCDVQKSSDSKERFRRAEIIRKGQSQELTNLMDFLKILQSSYCEKISTSKQKILKITHNLIESC